MKPKIDINHLYHKMGLRNKEDNNKHVEYLFVEYL